MAIDMVAVVLAAGKGTRMRSKIAKVLHDVLGRPMVTYPVGAALEAGADGVVVVVGHQGEAVQGCLDATFPDADLRFATQSEQRGTGHALQCAMDATEDATRVLILCGDTPALDADALRSLKNAHDGAGATLTVGSAILDDATGYGRIVRTSEGGLTEIVEHGDATAVIREIREVNTGLYLVDRHALSDALKQLNASNAQGELYLTDVVQLVAAQGGKVQAHVLDDPMVIAGVNTRAQLTTIEQCMVKRRVTALMREGVSFQDPDSVRIETSVRVGADTMIGPNVQLLGDTSIGEGVTIETGSILRDCMVESSAHVRPYVVGDGAHLGTGSVVGPFTHLRSGTELGRDTKVGNFVETKKASLGDGSKASHLSYLGDCTIGRNVNVGAGTITCNYDGFEKHQTILEDGVFVGSDTQLVAPVRVGKNATIAAGTTVTQDVPPEALALSRTAQESKEGYYGRRRKPREEASDSSRTPTKEDGGDS